MEKSSAKRLPYKIFIPKLKTDRVLHQSSMTIPEQKETQEKP